MDLSLGSAVVALTFGVLLVFGRRVLGHSGRILAQTVQALGLWRVPAPSIEVSRQDRRYCRRHWRNDGDERFDRVVIHYSSHRLVSETSKSLRVPHRQRGSGLYGLLGWPWLSHGFTLPRQSIGLTGWSTRNDEWYTGLLRLPEELRPGRSLAACRAVTLIGSLLVRRQPGLSPNDRAVRVVGRVDGRRRGGAERPDVLGRDGVQPEYDHQGDESPDGPGRSARDHRPWDPRLLDVALTPSSCARAMEHFPRTVPQIGHG